MKNNKLVYLVIVASLLQLAAHGQVKKVGAIGITVAEMDRSVKFYSEVLGFHKISDVELYGTA